MKNVKSALNIISLQIREMNFSNNGAKWLEDIHEFSKYFLKVLTKPNGPILGAKEDVAPTSPPTHLKYTKTKTS